MTQSVLIMPALRAIGFAVSGVIGYFATKGAVVRYRRSSRRIASSFKRVLSWLSS